MTALHREIKRLLAEYNRTEPIGAVEALVLRERPEFATVTSEQWANADENARVFLDVEIMLAANRLAVAGQQQETVQ